MNKGERLACIVLWVGVGVTLFALYGAAALAVYFVLFLLMVYRLYRF